MIPGSTESIEIWAILLNFYSSFLSITRLHTFYQLFKNLGIVSLLILGSNLFEKVLLLKRMTGFIREGIISEMELLNFLAKLQ